mmetsp:Transcript_2582/g.7321  ORF Transcript_2582/g.7321 Transcript_2582/m.7321 type:complete len:355 (+) Transcript_2582:136-1200(+)
MAHFACTSGSGVGAHRAFAGGAARPVGLRASRWAPSRHGLQGRHRAAGRQVVLAAGSGEGEGESGVQVSTAIPNAFSEPIPTKLNRVPHPREIRYHFYNLATKAAKGALEAGESRIQMRLTIPELNPEMDVYRIGTMLEMVREMAMAVALDGRKTKVCVQQPLGEGFFTGLPLSLSGVRRILEMMDWGEAAPFVALGQVGEDQVDDETDVFILISPQNIVNGTVIYELTDMVAAAEEKGKAIILVNPILKDVPSSGGVMGVRGRAERINFANSFVTAGHFRLLYKAGTFYPIVGALRYVYGGKWEVYKRVDVTRKTEEYQVIGEFDTEPGPREITQCFEDFRKQQKLRQQQQKR